MEPKPLASRTGRVEPSAVAEMLKLGRELEQKGRKVVRLVQGEPDFSTPQHIKGAVQEGLSRGLTRYVPNQGIPELREAVAEKLKRDNLIEADPKTEILITNGGQLGLFLALMATVEAGDEVLMADPTFGNFASMARLAGGVPVFVPLEKRNGRFHLGEEVIARHVSPRTKAFIVNTPGNPTGNVMSREELDGIGRLAVRHGFYLILDEVYEKLIFPGYTHHSLASFSDDIRKRSITVNSFSKTYAMTGWRLGYTVAPRQLAQAMSNMYQLSARCATAFVQYAGIAALQGPQDCVRQMVAEYARRRDLVVKLLGQIPDISCVTPEGTFYAFVDVSKISGDSWAVARFLLSEGGVLTSPGAFYGACGEGHIRLSFATSDDQIRDGIARMGEALARFPRR